MRVIVTGATPLMREALAALLRAESRTVAVQGPPETGDFVVSLGEAVPAGFQGISLPLKGDYDVAALRKALPARRVAETRLPYDAREAQLTPREQEVARLIGQGLSNEEIANVLGIRPQSIRNLVFRLRVKLGLDNRIQIALRNAGGSR